MATAMNEEKPLGLEYLHDERTMILRHIQEIRVAQRSKQNRANLLDELVVKYNNLMDQLEKEDSVISTSKDPLEVLPNEIWQDILSLDLWKMDEILTFTLVSQSWQKKIIASPLLWTNIQVDLVCHDMRAKIATFLQLSSGLPLRFKFEVSIEIANMIVPLIEGQGYRIQSITLLDHFSSNPPSTLDCDQFLNMLVGISGELTALENILFSGKSDRMPRAERILKNATEIRSISGIRTSPETFCLNSMQKLRNLGTQQPIQEVVPYIQNLDRLDTLFLYERSSNIPENTDPISKVWIKSGMALSASSPWKLTRVTIDDCSGELGWSLLAQASNSVRILKITISWVNLPDFIGVSYHMPQLSDLSLELPVTLNNGFQYHPSSNHIIGVRKLNLSIWSKDGYNEVMIAACHASASRLGEILISWIPDIDYLSIFTRIDHSFLTPYIQSLQNLKALSATANYHASASIVKVTLPSVEEIQISGKSSIFDSFYYPNARHLTLTDSIGFPFKAIHESIPVYPGAWSSLISLEIGGQKINWCDISIPSVEKIVVGDRFPTGRNPSNLLIKNLASNLHSFPSLKHLGVRFIPEWDLLFIMLENRNFSTNSTANPITTIFLPSLPSTTILKPLVKLLGKKLTMRPSNYHLSVLSIAKIYLDSHLLGCSLCPLAHLRCDTPFRFTKPRIGSNFILDLRPPPYPLSNDAVLASWEGRFAWWIEKIGSIGDRGFPCHRHDTYNLTSVTAYSSENLPTTSTAESTTVWFNQSFFGEEGV